MKKIYFGILLMLLVSMTVFSQNREVQHFYPAGYDSLLFDGASTLSPTAKCPILVKYATGFAEATIIHERLVMVCGTQQTEVTYDKGQVKINDELNPGDEITTGPGAYMEISFPDGSLIRMAPNSKVIVGKDWCEDHFISDILGDVWHKVKKIIGGNKFDIKTETVYGGVRGTEFTVSTVLGSDTAVTFKVYEGTVELQLKKIDQVVPKNVDMYKQIDQLGKDLKDKKITNEEYMKKLQELGAQMKPEDTPQKITETVTAGNMCKVDSKIGEVEPIPSSENKWFDDANFKK